MNLNDLGTPFSGDLPLTSSGDVALASGLPSLQAWATRAAFTSPGTLLHRPTFGVGLQGFLGQPQPRAKTLSAAALRRALLADRRVDEATITVEDLAVGQVQISAAVRTVDDDSGVIRVENG